MKEITKTTNGAMKRESLGISRIYIFLLGLEDIQDL